MAFSEEAYRAKYAGTPKSNSGKTGGFASFASVGAPIKPTNYVRPSGVAGVVQKFSDIGGQTVDLGATIARKTASYVGNFGKTTAREAGYITDFINNPAQNKVLAQQSKQLGQIQDNVMADYESGKMSYENYRQAIDDLSKAFSDNAKESMKIAEVDPLTKTLGIADFAATALSLGTLKLAQVAGKEAYQAGGTAALKSLIDDAATPLEKVIMKVPAVRALVERNLSQAARREAQKIAGENSAQYLLRESKKVAVDLLIKRPLFYQTNIAETQKLYNSIIEKNAGGALASSAWLGIQMVEGGPLGLLAKGGSWATRALNKAAHGKASYIDELSKRIGNGNASQGAEYIVNNKAAEKTFRIAQELNLTVTNGNVMEAVDNTLTNYVQAGYDLKKVTFKMIEKDLKNWAKAEADRITEIKAGKIKGVKPEDISKYAVVRWDSVTKQGLAEAIVNAGDNKSAQLAVLVDMASRPGVGWGNNEILVTRLKGIINKGKSAEDAAKAIKAVETASVAVPGMSKAFSNKLAKLGYTVAAPFGGNKIPILDYSDAIGSTRRLVSGAIDGDTSIFDPSYQPEPIIQAFSQLLERAGLSPQAASSVGNRKLYESLVVELDKIGLTGALGVTTRSKRAGGDITNGAKAVLSKLQNYIQNKPAVFGWGNASSVTDVRQLTTAEVRQVLGITKDQAKEVSRAIMDGYLKTPMEFRGLGDKIVDNIYRINPLHKYYSRIQSAFRYTYNPFFRIQERTETKLLSHGQANNLIWTKSRTQLNEAAQVLDDAKIFNSSLPGEAAQDQVFGRITASITKGQKRDLAGLAWDMAEARGMTVKELVAKHPEEIDDALRVVVQYPRKGVLASPLARTMNLMFFPMRYNVKVTQLAAQVLAKQPPSVQMAVIHSGFKMKDWLKSDEGIAWQSAHADAIQLLGWITPINSIAYTMNLLSHRPDSVAELGQLGGLPLGFITQILDSQGVIHLNRPYVNPKTGDLFPDYIPNTTKARASVALTDLLGSMFTYPGRTLGLPGKQATLKKAVRAFIDTNGTEFDKELRTEELTPLQQNWIRVLKGDTSEEAVDALYNSPSPGKYNGYTIPPLDLPIKRPTTAVAAPPKRTGLPSTAKSPRQKKTALPIPPRQ